MHDLVSDPVDGRVVLGSVRDARLSEYPWLRRFAFFRAPKIRLVLDLLFVSALSLWLRPRWLVVTLVGSSLAYLGLVTYFHYFLRPLSFWTLATSWREGLQLSGFVFDLFPKAVALGLLVMLAIKLAAVARARRFSAPRPGRPAVLCCAGGGLRNAVRGRQSAGPAVRCANHAAGVGRLGEIRGYLGPWLAEWYYLGDENVLRGALEMRERQYDRITPLEADIPIRDRIVIVQAESLDTNVLGYRVNGVEVMPFLNHLRDSSMYFRVRAIHNNGSSDADFVAMNGVAGSKQENTYVIPGYPYENTTPQILSELGYQTHAYHGNSGEFYNRRIRPSPRWALTRSSISRGVGSFVRSQEPPLGDRRSGRVETVGQRAARRRRPCVSFRHYPHDARAVHSLAGRRTGDFSASAHDVPAIHEQHALSRQLPARLCDRAGQGGDDHDLCRSSDDETSRRTAGEKARVYPVLHLRHGPRPQPLAVNSQRQCIATAR